jgi:hypothetical protein
MPGRLVAVVIVVVLAPIVALAAIGLGGSGEPDGGPQAQMSATSAPAPVAESTPSPAPSVTATATATATPVPTPPPTPTPPPRPFLDEHRLVAYYGNPLSPLMGIVGEHEPAELVRRLRRQADVYQALSPDRRVVPAIEFIYGVAQAGAGSDGLYLGRMDEALVRKWIQITKDNGLQLILDMQFGRSTVDREIPLMYPYLMEPHVHLALDPEFAWSSAQGPSDIGHLDAKDINRAQELLSNFAREHHLSNKILIVHQFRHDMITNKDKVVPHERVELVWHADGFGAAATKVETWNAVIKNDGVERAGIKLFYKHDAQSGGLMSEADIMALEPTPVIVSYQ